MQRLMFSRIEAWVLVLVVLLMTGGTVLFGWMTLDAERGDNRFGSAGQAALALAEGPQTAIDLLNGDHSIEVWNSARYDGTATGWTFTQPGAAGLPEGYLLFSRYDGTIRRHVTELMTLKTGEVLHRWMPDGGTLLADAARTSVHPTYWAWDSEHFRQIHPLALKNGDLIVKDHNSPLYRIDACARRVWMNDSEMFHHSTEIDADGNLWVPGNIEPPSVKGVPRDFFDDNIAKVSQDGEVLFSRSVTEVLLAAGYRHLLFTNGMYNPDPIHMNDIQPVLQDGPHWKKGDVFLSLRNISTIMLYRPSEDRIVWMKAGPWVSQHDVDILDDHRISVYDNNAQDRGGLTFFDGHSEIAVYDFATDTVTWPWSKAMEAAGIRTAYAGEFTALPGGYAMIEDVTNARFLIFTPDGSVAAEYMNRAEDGKVYHLGWIRYLDPAFGATLVQNLQKVKCDA
ncbi:MAG: arylsulfotransferase family protein [Paracoccaceae bacterium]